MYTNLHFKNYFLGYNDHSHSENNKKSGMVGSHWNNLRIAFVVLFVLDLFFFIAFPKNYYCRSRISTFLRPLMIILRIRNFRHIMRAVIWSGTRISRVFIIISFHVIFCGFVAFVLFSGTPTTHFSELSNSTLEKLKKLKNGVIIVSTIY